MAGLINFLVSGLLQNEHGIAVICFLFVDEPKKKTFVSVFSFSHIKQNSSLTANSDVSSQKGGDANSLSLCMTISSYNSEPFLKRKLV